ncbi:hypothetical protein HYY75_03725 [bacterium]|nr:hypothetical protein [bacterium]
MLILGGLRNFSSHRIQSSIREWNNLKAESAAESGVSLILAELGQNLSLETHVVNANLTWGNAKNYQAKSFDGIHVSNNGGDFSGVLGSGYSFHARCGCIPYADDPSTRNVDESKAFLLIESIGKYDSFGKATFRKISSVVNRRFPAKECLLYDGQVLSVVFGETTNTGTNVFADGNLYGHLGVEVGRVTRSNFSGGFSGTDQRFENVEKIMSGKGGLFFFTSIAFKILNGGEKSIDSAGTNRIPISWDGPYGPIGPNNVPYTKGKGGYPESFLNNSPEIPSDLKDYLRDKNNPTIMNPAYLPLDYFKNIAGGVTNGPMISHKNYTGGMTEMVVLDFGDAIRPVSNPPNIPSGGVIYSDKDIVIRGNPSSKITVVSAKGIYVDGDFNQKGSGSQAEKYCFPQDYSGEPKKPENFNYQGSYKKMTPGTQYQVARIMANERVVFDYGDIKLCFGNELYPYLKFRIAKELMNDETKASTSFLNVGGDEKIEATATEDYSFTTTTTSTSGNSSSGQSSGSSGNESEKKNEALAKAKDKLVKSLREYLTKSDSLRIPQATYDSDFKPLLDPHIQEDTAANPNVRTSSSSSSQKNSNGTTTTTTTTTTTKTVTVKFFVDAAWSEDFGKKVWGKLTEVEGQKKLYSDQIAKFGSSDRSNDYLFFPELSTVGMFISFGKRSPQDTFCAGPDVAKHFEEMGRVVPDFIHRLYGSQTAFRVNDVTGAGTTYDPPIRKKVYDTEFPKIWDENGPILDIPTYGILSWKKLAAPSGFSSF